MKKNNLILTIVVLTVILFSTSGNAQTVTIGSQVWTSKNLDVETYRNGDVIPQVQNTYTWDNLTTGAWCYYNNDASNGPKYGKLYNWYAVHDPRGLAPNGYHIPTNAEWTILTDYLGGECIAGKKMKSASGWESYTTGGSKTCPNCASWNEEYRKKVPCHTCKDKRSVLAPTVTHSGNGSNSSGFSALPGGNRGDRVFTGSVIGGDLWLWGCRGSWWSFKVASTDDAWVRTMEKSNDCNARSGYEEEEGLSVRCVRD